MSAVEEVSIALPADVVSAIRDAVATGEYASISEVVREALRDWMHQRSLRLRVVAVLRPVWQEAMEDQRPGVDADAVLDRLARKYQALADAPAQARNVPM